MAEVLEKSKNPKIILQFLRDNPWWGIIGVVVGILSLSAAIFIFVVSQKSRNLVYTINPTRTQIVKAGESSKLKVKYDSIEVHSDLYAIHIALWNDGKLPIKKENILHPIIIKVDSEVNLLESSFTTISRSVTELHIGSASANSIKIDWKILENNDGGVLQIIYEGGVNAKFKVEGIVEGQNNISEAEQNKDVSANDPMVLFILCIGYLAFIIKDIYRADKISSRIKKILGIVYRIISLTLLILTIIILVNLLKNNIPPFPF